MATRPDLATYTVDMVSTPEAIALLRTWLNFGWDYRIDVTGNTNMLRDPQAYIDRVEHELKLIVDKGFVDYFLVTSDIVRWAKDHGILVGPGRGSASASLVCYLLRITEIDPIVFHRLMFERFIDPTRSELPDIDLDFDDERRHEVFEYCERKYGADKVGKMANFMRYKGKNSIDDVARVYNIPKWEAEQVKKLIIERGGGDSRESNSLEDTFAVFPRAREVADRHPQILNAIRLEGGYRGMGVHAAGMVISNTPITDSCATYTKTTAGVETSVVAFDKKDSKYLGFLKLDILGLSTMNVIAKAAEFVGMSIEDVYRIPLDDKKTMKAFKRGDVVGIFQFEGRATRLVCKDVKPDTFQELVDINSLSRPGPLFSGTTAQYVDIKHGRAWPESLHPVVDEETEHTHGQIIFQEQILRIIKRIGGFPMDRVHEIRQIISQKLGESQFGSFYERFEHGAKEIHGIDSELALKIWRFMVTSATYTFVTAHSTGYSLISWWCMWFKVHHPAAFYAARLRKEADEYKRTKLIKDALNHGVEVVPPDPLFSEESWTPEHGNTVRAGFIQIPGVGPKTAQAILDYLESNYWETAPTWRDLIKVKGIGPKTIEKIEAFVNDPDPFGVNRIRRILEGVRRDLQGGKWGIPEPTHTSDELAEDGSFDVVWVGIPLSKEYKDIVEDERARTDKSTEEILASIKDPELTKLCVVKCIDDGDEDVHCRINRWEFPRFADRLEDLRTNGKDVIIVQGRKRDGFGTNIVVREMWALELD
ncbi:DnaE-like DNA polymerase III alpha [Mycobacterium phage Leopard]|uniref:DnaE-like DNA polymerase III n=1 Tax=Mycobacterium phage Onyinye TaxID=2686235 RepID=A0A6B9LD37_9CAUD|nr:DnaE-like DNA polymerase III [Mycobacterium phage Onyinye]QHB37488.1 DnaE-like DNA polymerase III [Mycobacterium phage Onyinye]UOW92960.1 DnaE-like DNA polymerase III alpha [Mycobacterium phage Leopard]WKW85247.1 DnaE-like DNA polymerase III alpha [Mycobacterium phage Aikoy]